MVPRVPVLPTPRIAIERPHILLSWKRDGPRLQKDPRVGTTRGTKRQTTRASSWSRWYVSWWWRSGRYCYRRKREVLVQAHVACSRDYPVSILCRDIPCSSRRSPYIPSLQRSLVDPKMEPSRCVAKCTPLLLLLHESVCLFDVSGRVFLIQIFQFG
jgi:hypothetical protein